MDKPTSRLTLKTQPTLGDFQRYVEDMVAERGFRRTLAQKFMLLTEEAGELSKAARKHDGQPLATDSIGSDVAHEAADLLMVLLDICNTLNIDLEQAFREKEEQNKQRTWK